MNTTKQAMHTQGPWKFHIGRGSNPRLHIQTTGGYQIASTPEISRHELEAADQYANAHLLSASPELLCMLQRLVDSVAMLPELPGTISLLDMEQARSAIEKARGGKSV